MTRTGTSVYPATLDSFDRIGTANYEDESGYAHVNVHNEAMDGIENLESVFGTTSGTDLLSGVTAGDVLAKTNNETFGTPAITGGTATSQTLAGTPVLDADSCIPFYSDSIYRQALINGNFDVWQRGTSFTGISPYYGADRWQMFRDGAVAGGTWARQTASLSGSLYSARCQRDEANDATQAINLAYSMETTDAMKLRGSKVTLSFWAKKGANYSGASDALAYTLKSGTGTNQSISTGFTDSADIATGTATLTTSWQKFTVTTAAVVGDTINEIGILFAGTPVGTAGANDWFEVTQVQLCAGSVALPFMPKSYEDELRACQRYCIVYSGAETYYYLGVAKCATTTIAVAAIHLPVEMRVTPTLTATAADWAVDSSIDVTAIASSNLWSNNKVIRLSCTVAAGLTAGHAAEISADGNANRALIFSSEL